MKPAFALDFRNDAIALLHRTPGGWHQIGRVAIDEPDLEAAMAYMRSTAMGLSPRGIASKLILPDDQILYTSLEAPGPDEASRAAQIRAGLEGRTPYPVDDLVYDWEAHGDLVRVAVMARETLDEAEAFAVEHRFNPVSFVAAPEADRFGREPWFGQTSLSAGLLAPGETVERDIDVVEVTGRSLASPKVDSPAAPVDDVETVEDPDPRPEPEGPPEVEPEPAPEIEPEPEKTPEPAPEEIPLDDPEYDPAPGPEYEPDPAPEPLTSPDWMAEPATPGAPTPVFGLAEGDLPPSRAFGREPEQRFDDVSEPYPIQSFMAATQSDQPAAELLEPSDEAPMAIDVEDTEGSSPASDVQDPGLSLRSSVTDPAIDDDVPPLPGYSPAMGFASRRAGTDPAGVKTPPPVRAPSVDRPAAARPAPPVSPKADRPMIARPAVGKPAVAKDTKGLRGLGALVTAPGIAGSRKKKVVPPIAASSAATLAPSTAATAAAATTSPTAKPAANPARPGLGGLSSRPDPVRGKPRYLGLVLTALLLLALAVIAAWSTQLAFRGTEDAAVQTAATPEAASPEPTDIPAPEDEMLADQQDPAELPVDPDTAAAADETVADGTLAQPAPVAEPVAEAAPDAVANAATDPAATAPAAGNDPQDEIFLATMDQAPEAPDPLALPAAEAKGDPLPLAQAPPPPFGTVYKFDANGLIVPTPEGIMTPEGVLLVAGKPPVVPAPRPDTVVAAAASGAVTTPDAATPETAPGTAAADQPFPSDPALSGFRPRTRPEGLAPAANPDDASLAPAADSRFASLRPKVRPEAIIAAGDSARAASAAASLAAQAEATAEAEAVAAATASASKMAVAISRKPAQRPRDLSRAVEAAVAAAVRAPEPKAEPEPEPEPEKVAASKGSDPGKEIEADQEPELVSAAPRVKQNASVAKQATFKNAINLGKTALIGVYGTPSKRYAMIRTEGGRYKKVKIGDKIDGGKIQAITASEVRYQKGSKLLTLAMPKG